MAEIHAKRIDEKSIDAVLAGDIEFEGDVFFDNDFLVKGTIKGDVRSTGTLYVGKTATVEADIKAAIVYVHGKVKGNITASKWLELRSSAEVFGDIQAPQITIEPGCIFEGTSKMG